MPKKLSITTITENHLLLFILEGTAYRVNFLSMFHEGRKTGVVTANWGRYPDLSAAFIAGLRFINPDLSHIRKRERVNILASELSRLLIAEIRAEM